jgi:hypothetical protein
METGSRLRGRGYSTEDLNSALSKRHGEVTDGNIFMPRDWHHRTERLWFRNLKLLLNK